MVEFNGEPLITAGGAMGCGLGVASGACDYERRFNTNTCQRQPAQSAARRHNGYADEKKVETDQAWTIEEMLTAAV
jgi:hypothetical protein